MLTGLLRVSAAAVPVEVAVPRVQAATSPARLAEWDDLLQNDRSVVPERHLRMIVTAYCAGTCCCGPGRGRTHGERARRADQRRAVRGGGYGPAATRDAPAGAWLRRRPGPSRCSTGAGRSGGCGWTSSSPTMPGRGVGRARARRDLATLNLDRRRIGSDMKASAGITPPPHPPSPYRTPQCSPPPRHCPHRCLHHPSHPAPPRRFGSS